MGIKISSYNFECLFLLEIISFCFIILKICYVLLIDHFFIVPVNILHQIFAHWQSLQWQQKTPCPEEQQYSSKFPDPPSPLACR